LTTSSVTVAVVPRERFSLTERSLVNLYEQTTVPFNLVYVSAGAPSSVQRYLENASDSRGFRLIGSRRPLSPNQARNLALREVSTKYVVFLDNDALVTPGWLESLVKCADDTGAAIVGPLYLIGEIEHQTIHMAGGTLHFKNHDGHRVAYDEHRLGDVRLGDLTEPLRRQTCDFVEFHCMLLRTDLFHRLGPLDERLFSLHEHIDIGWAAREAGGAVYLEPTAVASYVAPPPFEWSDLSYFMLRWSDDWAKRTIDHFNSKWEVATTRHFGDEDSSLALEDTAIRWVRAHRCLATGLQIPGDWDDRLESAFEQARLEVALFQSVGRDSFDLALTTADDVQLEIISGLTPEMALEQLPAVLDRAERDRLNVVIRPRPARRPGEPALVRVDLDAERLKKVEPYAFLTLRTGPDTYQVWIAVDNSNWRSARILKRLTSASAEPNKSTAFTRIAGSLIADVDPGPCVGRYARSTLHRGVAGIIATGMDLESSGVLADLWSSGTY
jgi:glycosyltransferase involved in cell wall biosynthesis